MFGPDLGDGPVVLAAFPAGIGHEEFFGLFFAGDGDFFGVDDDHEVPGIEVRGEDGFVFTAQGIGNLHGQTAEDGPVGINDMPLALIHVNFRQMRFHPKS